MKISRADQFHAGAAPAVLGEEPAPAAAAGETLLVFLDAAGRPARWLAFVPDGVARRGEGAEDLPAAPRCTILAVPGDAVAIRWLDLPEELTPAQAAAAARLQAGEHSAQPVSELHVAAGRGEEGRIPVAVVPVERMTSWLEAAASLGLDPVRIVPEPLLLLPPQEGFVRYDGFAPPAWRARAGAFGLEPELAAPIVGDAPVALLDQSGFEAGLPQALAAPALDLRQGAFGRARRLNVEGGAVRRLAALGAILLLLTLAVQIAGVMRYAFAADRLEAEAAALRTGAGPAAATRFAPAAGQLFDAVRATPNAELSALSWSGEGVLRVSVLGDSPATLGALEQRIAASGASIVREAERSAGGRAAADLVVRFP